ncbi:MAG: excinuclease ABC subunit UvrA [Chloroflexi bacterium]|nr:excinuclease ABC subunit UvrA [Chloroflexota bacterium]
MQNTITIKGAKLHNLKNISLSIPKYQVVVLTGLSGSGKSTLAFDTLHKEGQRQYMESLGMVDYMGKPEVDSITGLSPSISVDQHLINRSPRSTVGTATEVFTYLRVLFARIGHRVCVHCGADIPPSHDVALDSDESGETDVTYPCPACGTPIPELGMAHFSFNKPIGACPTCTGLGVMHGANLPLLIDPALSILDGGVLRWDIHEIKRYTQTIQTAGEYYGFAFDPALPIGELGEIPYDILLHGVSGDRFRRHFPNIEPPDTVSKGRFEGLIPNLMRRYADNAHNAEYRENLQKFLVMQPCPDCNGERLRPESRRVTINGRTIIEAARMPLNDLREWLTSLEETLSPEARIISEPVVIDLRERIHRLIDVGVGYLTLERATPSLSAGEAQRLRLAALLGSGLTGVLYVLDEPTIGLHPRDNRHLIEVLRRLRDLGNTVLVVEHDLDLIRAADYVIDIGPGAGQHGGEVVAAGTPEEIALSRDSITGDYLAGRAAVPVPPQRRPINQRALTIRGARSHNLKNLTVDLPLGTLLAVAGVTGSGKSSLILDTLGRAAEQRYYGASERPGEHDSISGWQWVDKVIMIDQTPIGRTSRSNAATYTDAFTPIRQTFAALPDAQGLSSGHFSFNVPGGRCERCQGAGLLTVNMHFLPDVEVTCPACRGQRFRSEVLAVKYRGFDISEVLNLTIEEALLLFEEVPAVANRLALMVDVGLGYLKLGQPATMLSGGEAQRIKLAKELSRRAAGHTLYLMDEPTTGLHPADIVNLLAVMQRLVDADNTVIVIEHNLDIIRAADWIIELGPEGGDAGGKLIAQGTPEEIAANLISPTGRYLFAEMVRV